MAIEIERKFLLKPGAPLPDSDAVLNIQQAYLASDRGMSIRVRIVNQEEAHLTIKQAAETNLSVRQEFEYAVPIDDAIEMMQLSHYTPIVKQRHIINVGDNKWEVDFFLNDNEGLIIAELELPEEGQLVDLPDWIGDEVTDNPKYLNNYLAQFPFTTWND